MNRNIVITGGTSGLGEALVKYFIDNGDYVHCIARNEAICKRLKSSFGDQSYLFTYDLFDFNAFHLIHTLKYDKKIDVFILNAGFGLFDSFNHHSEAIISQIVQVNYIAPLLLLKHFESFFNKNVSIVGVTSLSAKVSTPYAAVYASSKAGFYQFLNAYRLETDYHVLTVNTGPIQTPFHEKANAKPNKRLDKIKLDSTQLAKKIDYAIKKRKLELNAPIWMSIALNTMQIAPRTIEKIIKPLLLTKQK